MIVTKVYYVGGLVAGFHLEGHSPQGLGAKGENLLCAGVSTLVQTAHSYLEWRKLLETEEKRDGYLEFLVKTKELKELQNVLQMIEFGLRSLAKNHPESIQIEEEIIKR